MTISIQTLHDVLVALAAVGGLTVAFTLAIVAAGALSARPPRVTVGGAAATTPGQPVAPKDSQELVLR